MSKKALKLRPEVNIFSQAMEQKLIDNDHKGGWDLCDNDFLWSKLIEEISELRREIDNRGSSRKNSIKVLEEGADVANIIMMIVDNNTAIGTLSLYR